MQEVKKDKKRKKRRNIFLKVAVLVFVFYIVFVLLNQQNTMKQKEGELQNLDKQLQAQQAENAELRDLLVLSNEEMSVYIEEKAKEKLGYADANERVFVGVTGE